MRKMMMKGFTGQTENPLIAAYKHDRELLHLEADASKLRSLMRAGYLRSPMCFMPCFWPHQLLMGIPCTFLFCTLPRITKSAEAHKLVLREKSLLYQVDKYPQAGANSSSQQAAQPCCTVCVGGDAGGFVDVIPLQDIESVTVEVLVGIEPWFLEPSGIGGNPGSPRVGTLACALLLPNTHTIPNTHTRLLLWHPGYRTHTRPSFDSVVAAVSRATVRCRRCA